MAARANSPEARAAPGEGGWSRGLPPTPQKPARPNQGYAGQLQNGQPWPNTAHAGVDSAATSSCVPDGGLDNLEYLDDLITQIGRHAAVE